MTLQIMVKPESTEGFEKIDELEEMKEALLAQEEAAATKTIDKGFRKKQV